MKKCCIALIGMLGCSTLNAVCKDLMCDPLARIHFERFTKTGQLRADKGPLRIAISEMDTAAMIERAVTYEFPDPSQQKTISCDTMGATVLGYLVARNPEPFLKANNLRISLRIALDPPVSDRKAIKCRMNTIDFPAMSKIADKIKDIDFSHQTITPKIADFIENTFAAGVEHFRFTLSSFYDDASREKVLNILQQYSNGGAIKLHGETKRFVVYLKKKLRLNGELSAESNEITINNYFFNWDYASSIRADLNCLSVPLKNIQLHWYRTPN